MCCVTPMDGYYLKYIYYRTVKLLDVSWWRSQWLCGKFAKKGYIYNVFISFSASLFVIGDLVGCVVGGPVADRWVFNMEYFYVPLILYV